MRRIVNGIAILGALVFVAAGCGGDDGAEVESATVSFDQAFIDAMVPHHEEAIEMAKAAKEAGLSEPELVEIADAIIATQQAEIDQLLAWREEWFGSREIDPAGAAEMLGMSESEMGMQHGAEDLAGAEDVDQAFAAMMIDHHRGAIEMAEMALERAEHEELEDVAQAIIEAQEREASVMEEHAMEMEHS